MHNLITDKPKPKVDTEKLKEAKDKKAKQVKEQKIIKK